MRYFEIMCNRVVKNLFISYPSLHTVATAVQKVPTGPAHKQIRECRVCSRLRVVRTPSLPQQKSRQKVRVPIVVPPSESFGPVADGTFPGRPKGHLDPKGGCFGDSSVVPAPVPLRRLLFII